MRTPFYWNLVLLGGVAWFAGCGSPDTGEGDLCGPGQPQCKGQLFCVLEANGESRCRSQAPQGADASVDAMADARRADAGPPPDTFIDDPKPPQRTTSAMATFNLRSSQGMSTFRCSLDQQPYAACNATHMITVPEGVHTINVKAVNREGTEDPTPATYTWAVDTTAPDTTITSGPPKDAAPTDVTFQFTATEAGATFTCKMDTAAAESCATGKNYAGLSVGEHTFTVFATDQAGNKDATPAEYKFTVTTVVPVTTATCPNAVVGDDFVDISFASDTAGGTFRCIVDSAAETTCTSPFKVSNLADGDHTFSVVAVTAAGVRDPSPATCAFEINAVAPEVRILTPIGGQKVGRRVTVTYQVVPFEEGLTYTCTAGTKTESCDADGTVTFTDLPLGPLTIKVVVQDSLLNTSEDAVAVTVVAGPPVTVTLDKVINGFARGTGTATWTVDKTGFPNVEIVCKVNGTVVDCVDPLPYGTPDMLPHGSSLEVEVTATDTDSKEFVTGLATATIDNEQPTISRLVATDSSSRDGDAGPIAGDSVVFRFEASDTVESGATYVCDLDGIPFACAPGTDILLDVLGDGMHTVTILATDFLGTPPDPSRTSYTFQVDALGPVLTLVNAPGTTIVCPDADDSNAIRWYAKDPDPPSTPITFECRLRLPRLPSGALGPEVSVTCSTISNPNGTGGEYRWTDLNDGEHILTVIAKDAIGNAGAPLVVPFFVDNTPPHIEVSIRSSIDVMNDDYDPNDPNNPSGYNPQMVKVTSGGNTYYGEDDILVWVHDDGPDTDPNEDHPPVVITRCEVLGANGTGSKVADCTCEEMGWETSDGSCPSNLGRCFVCDFTGLDDDDSKHLAHIVAEDSCGSVNEGDGMRLWLVDSSPDTLTAGNFSDPNDTTPTGSVFVVRDPNGPGGDIIDGTARFNLNYADQLTNDEYISSDNPISATCTIDGSSVACSEGTDNGANTDYYLALNLSDANNPHTFSAVFEDGVGNSTTLPPVSFYVDSTPPDVAFDARFLVDDANNPVTCDYYADGTQLSRASGKIKIRIDDDPNDVDSIPTAGLLSGTCQFFQVSDPNDLDPNTAVGSAIPCTVDNAVQYIPFTALTHGLYYRLRVSVVDNVGHSNVEWTPAWRIDAQAPPVVFASPRAALERNDPNDPYLGETNCPPGISVANDKCTLFANIVPKEDDTGAFDSDRDDANTPIDWKCFIDGVAITPCDPHIGLPEGAGVDPNETVNDNDYPLHKASVGDLTEGSYTVQITARDCVGNTNPASGYNDPNNATNPRQAFFVDVAPPVITPSNITVADNSGLAQPILSMTDAITNIQSGECLVDFDASNNNPETTTPAGPSQACVFRDGEALSSQDDDVSTPKDHSGHIDLVELAAGKHKVWYQFRDIWGHTSTVDSFGMTATFTVDDPPTQGGRGHVVMMGHDFEDEGTLEPNNVTTNIEKILGDAVGLAPATGLLSVDGRGLRIAALDLGAAGTTAKTKALEGMDMRLDEVGIECGNGSFCMDVAEFGGTADSYLNLQGHLYGRDVLLIYDQNSSAAADIGANQDNDPNWEDVLTPFLTAGGIVVVLDGGSETVQILKGVVDVVDDNIGGREAETFAEVDCVSNNPLAAGVVDSGNVDNTKDYDVPAVNFVRFNRDGDPFPEEIFSIAACTDLPSTDCNYRPVVLDRVFPAKTERGPVRISAFDRGQPRNSVEGNAGTYAYALISTPSGAFDGFCRLRRDGTTTHEVTTGGMVSILSHDLPSAIIRFPGGLGAKVPTGINFRGIKLTQTVTGVKPYDLLDIGSTLAPPSKRGFARVSFPAYDVPANPLKSYFVTIGCLNDVINDVSSRTTTFSGDVVTDDCVFEDKVRAIVEARDTAGKTIAYATSVAFTADPNNVFTIDASLSNWPGGTQGWSDAPFDVIVTLQGATPFPVETAQGLLGSALGGFLYDEGYFIPQKFNGQDPPADTYWAPRLNLFATEFQVDAVLRTNHDGGSTPRSSRTRLIRNAAVPQGTSNPYGISRTSFLNPVDVPVAALSSNRPTITWSTVTSANLTSVATAVGGVGAVRYRARDCAIPGAQDPNSVPWVGIWEVFFDPNSPQSAGMPELPTDPNTADCWLAHGTQPPNTPHPLDVSYFYDDEVTREEYRLGAYDTLETYLGSTRARDPANTPLTKSTAFCSEPENTFFTSDTVELVCPAPPACSDGIDNDRDNTKACDSEEIKDPFSPCFGDSSDPNFPGDARGDGLIDYPNDPGCFSPVDDSETDTCANFRPLNNQAPPLSCPQCGNGIDDDNFGDIDANDAGCRPGNVYVASGASEGDKTQCSDGKNNDADTKIDLLDPGCFSPLDNTETDTYSTTCPNDDNCPGPNCNCPECLDGVNNDGDPNNFVDFGEDPQCIAAGDDCEAQGGGQENGCGG